MKKLTEINFESWIEQSLLKNGYHSSFIENVESKSPYDKELCSIKESVLEFIKSTQEKEYTKLLDQYGDETDSHLLKKIDNTIQQTDIIHLFREGIKTRGCHFQLYYTQPKSSLNTHHQSLYQKNRFEVGRQIHFSKENRQSVDMVVFLNGIPIITLELKNHFTGQSRLDSEKQYKQRDVREPLFRFKRCLVHLCVDNDSVSMTTELKGDKTKFLPYNRDITNPPIEGDYSTEYLWNDILTPNSLLDIIENYVLITEETSSEWNVRLNKVEEKKRTSLIFPRFHQLDVIRKLKSSIRKDGVGTNYLIQHTTGSGKSYSIGWLSHTLTSLYRNETDTKRMFDTILVLTDRKVLDKQLQSLISRLEQTEGVVHNVELTSQQLKNYLELGKDIIITTVQKFPYISEEISSLKSKTFGIIIDEVHSSQSGETSKHIKKSLSTSEEDEDDTISWEDLVKEEIKKRGKQPHISYFGFTGTPKNKTFELFGVDGENGEKKSFHQYSMKQSIREGFTLDVLSHYITYKRYFKLRRKSEGMDEELPESEVTKELIRFVDDTPQSIELKVSIIIEEFQKNTSKKIGGKGRGMVVVSSRKHCVWYHREMVKQLKSKGYPYTCLVGFSGVVRMEGREFTEEQLNKENGMVGTNIPEGFKNPQFRILIVSNKFQTGYDEPLLHSMFVDKKLSGVQCVQTLSRLNRKMSDKDDTFVLDFKNETEDIVSSFKLYYTTTVLSEVSDPDKLYPLMDTIHKYNLYTRTEVDEVCKLFFSKEPNDEKIQFILSSVKGKYDKMNDEDKNEYKTKVQSFLRLYSFFSQIISFTEVDWEKNYIFLHYLNKKIRSLEESKRVDYSHLVSLDSIRIQPISKSTMILDDEVGILEPMSSDGVSKKKEEGEKEFLSQIIEKLNNTFGSPITEGDGVYLGMVMDGLDNNEELGLIISSNSSSDSKKDEFNKYFDKEMVELYTEGFEFYKKMENKELKSYIQRIMFDNMMKQSELSKRL